VLNRFDAVVDTFDARDSIAWLALGKARLAARLWPGIRAGERLTAEVRPEDVLLCTIHPGKTSARNVLLGRVDGLRRRPEGVHVQLDVGFPLTALVTGGAVKDLALRKGTRVFALVKATAVVASKTVRAGVEVGLVGAKGTIRPEQVAFLRAIDRSGTMTGAARALGITYRTSWLWAQAVNRAWGSPLVARVRGGLRAGTSLTPEGRAALKLAAPPKARR